MPALWWLLSWIISNVCPDKSLFLSLEVIKPLLSTSSKLLHIPPWLISQRHGKSDRHVCVHAVQEGVANCYIRCQVFLSRRHRTELQASDPTGPGEAPGAWKKRKRAKPSWILTNTHLNTQNMVFSSAARRHGIITICPHTACCHHCKDSYIPHLNHSMSISVWHTTKKAFTMCWPTNRPT